MHLIAAELVRRGLGVLHGVAGHFRDALDEIIDGVGLAVGLVVLILAHHFVAGRNVGRRLVHGAGAFHDQAEAEHGGLLDVGDDVGVVAGVQAGELDLDAGVPDRADDGLGDAHAVDAVADDLDGLAELLAALVVAGLAVHLGRWRLEGERHPAFQVETELQRAFRRLEQIGQEDVVAFLDILERALQLDAREELGEIDPLDPADLLEPDVKTDIPALELGHFDGVIHPGHELGELRGFGGGLAADVGTEITVLQRQRGE